MDQIGYWFVAIILVISVICLSLQNQPDETDEEWLDRQW